MGNWEHEVSREELAITLFEESGDALFLFDPATEALLDVNPVAERLTGFSCESLLRMPITYLFRSPVQGGLDRLRKAFRTTGQFHSQEDFVLRHRQDGHWVPVNLTATRLHTRARTLGLITARDISERRRLEEKALRLATIVESSEDAIVGESLDGTILSWNAAAERLFGYSTQEIVGQPGDVLIPAEHVASCRALMTRLRRGEAVPPFEESRRHRDGKLVPVSVSLSALSGRNGEVVGTAATYRNISDRLRLEEEVRQSQKMEAVGQLAGGVAHDFNNLLTVISGYSAMLLERHDLDPLARSMVEEIHKAGERSASLTAQLLAFSRRTVLEPKVLNLNERLNGVEKMLRRLIGEDILLETHFEPDLGHVKVDPGQMDQVILNLAVNARDAMPRGGTLRVATANVDLDEAYAERHPAVRPGPYVRLSVADTGTGMDEKTLARVFEPFFTTKGPGKGTGLGLAVVHGIVTQSGGHIAVESELGRGSTFKIYLPWAVEVMRAGKSEPGTRKAPRGSETVLLVEDEDAVRRLARRALEREGYTVLEAAHGSEGVQVSESHPGPIHLLVSDVVMPGMSGRLLAEELSAARPAIKILFLSGYTDDAVVRHGVMGSAVNFLHKPFSPTALARKVREVLQV